jgi:hypothetical protein
MQCQAMTLRGIQCKNPARMGSNYCFLHTKNHQSTKEKQSTSQKPTKKFPGSKWFASGSSIADPSSLTRYVAPRYVAPTLSKSTRQKEIIPQEEYRFYYGLIADGEKEPNVNSRQTFLGFTLHNEDAKDQKSILYYRMPLELPPLRSVQQVINECRSNGCKTKFLLDLCFSMYVFTKRVNKDPFYFNLSEDNIRCSVLSTPMTKKYGLFTLEDSNYLFYVLHRAETYVADIGDLLTYQQMWNSFLVLLNEITDNEGYYSLSDTIDGELGAFAHLLDKYQERDGNINGLEHDLFVKKTDYYKSNDFSGFCHVVDSKPYQNWLKNIPLNKRGMLVGFATCQHNKTFFDIPDFATSYEVMNLEVPITWDFVLSLFVHVAFFIYGSSQYYGVVVLPGFISIYASLPKNPREITFQVGDIQSTITTGFDFKAFDIEPTNQDVNQTWQTFLEAFQQQYQYMVPKTSQLQINWFTLQATNLFDFIAKTNGFTGQDFQTWVEIPKKPQADIEREV